jgi:hypothetical protein
MMIRKIKRGDITTQQLVLLIILIVSFAVILFFIFRLNLGKTSVKEICHNSVITRGSSVLPAESIPLNCQTTYTCITKDGSCEKMSGSFETKKVKTETEVYQILADEMADCWWMFGEGKVNYVGKDLPANHLYCSICSQLAFDNSLEEIFPEGEIEQKNLYDYLSVTNISGEDMSYLDYLVGLKSSEEIESTLQDTGSDFGKINLENQHYVIMGITSDVNTLGWILVGAGLGAVGGAAIVFTAGLATPVVVAMAAGAITGSVLGHFGGMMIEGESGHDYLRPTIIEANSEDFEKYDCVDIKTLS